MAHPPTPVPAHVPPERVVDFDVYNPPGVERDLQQAWKRFIDSGVPDIVWCVNNGGHWLPTRGPLTARMQADHEHFSNRYQFLPKAAAEGYRGIPGSLDPPEHQAFRALLYPLLSPKAVMACEAEIRALAVSLIDALRGRGECDFRAEYAMVLPVHTFLRLYGLPLADAPMLLHLNEQIIRPTHAEMSVAEAIGRLIAYLQEPIRQRMGGNGTDMISRMVNGQVFGRPLSIEEALNMTLLVLQGGLDTVANLMSFAIRFLAENPAHRRVLVADPALIPAACEEMIRRFPVVVNARVVRQDMVYEGVAMKAGDPLALSTLIHGLEDGANAQAMMVDFQRTQREYSTFSNGIHRCVGSHLARLEFRITLEEWLRRVPEFEPGPGDIRCCGGLVGGMDRLPLRWDAATTR